MSDGDAVERSLDERYSKSALLVLGMHRSGTSAIAGALRLCGAWVGEETELTGTNVENPHGFWERRDMRRICDRLLHTAGADWWKVASFDPGAIPHAILAEQRREFGKVISALDEHETWVVKEPRLCLLLPVLRDYITDPVCIYIFRNPLEVARSLQMRNGFGIAAGLALWEVYNRRALSASENLPCVLVSHQSLMLHPVETLDGLVKRLDELAVTNLVRPDEGRLKQFINPSLYRRRATEEETEEYLSPSQRILWQQFRSDHIFDHDRSALISRTTRQYLYDLESAEQSLNHHKDRRLELSAELAKRVATIEARDATIEARNATVRGLTSRTEELSAGSAKRVATIEARDATVRGLTSRTEELSAELAKRVATIEARDATVRGLTSRTEELSAELAKRVATIEARDATIEARNATVRGLTSRTEELSAGSAKRVATIEARDATVRGLTSRTEELSAELAKRVATIEARDATVRGLTSRTEELSAELAKRVATVEARDATVRGLTSRTEEQSAELARRVATVEARDATVRGLLESTSWRITAPLRVLSRCVRWFWRNYRRAVKLLFWLGTGQFTRAISAIHFVIARSSKRTRSRRESQKPTSTESLSKRTREHGENGNRHTRATIQKEYISDKPKPKVSVIAWDLGHNPLGRAYLLADVLRNDYDVELIGANFPRFGNEIWQPLRSGSRIKIKSFPGGHFPEHFKNMEDIAEQIDGDIIYVSKPRLPSLELAILAKLHRNRPVILDIDDYELGFFKNRGPLTLEAVKAKGRKLDFDCPHDEIWTRYSESLFPLFEHVTVSNEELRKKFGGMILPHIRNEYDFDPTVYPRDAIRSDLGFGSEDKVILFAGTPRMHKGFARVASALKKLNRMNYKLLLIGSPTDSESRHFIDNIDSGHVKFVPNVSFVDLPKYLRAGDLICILQDKRKVVSHFQMPAKFTDGLSMCIPMLATNVPPLVNLARTRLVELLGDTPLDQKIDEIFGNYRAYKNIAEQNRKVFLAEYSYGANLPRLKATIDHLLNHPAPIPDEFRELVTYHREIFSSAAALPRVTAKVVAPGLANCRHTTFEVGTPVKSTVDRARDRRSYVDDKIDIVFFWKQNDTGIYGRRQDMLVKYLAKDPRIHRILHFDAPINFFQSGRTAVKFDQGGRSSHGRLVFLRTLERKLGRSNRGKIRFDTFIFGTKRHVPGFMRRVLPSEKDYLDYLNLVLSRHQIGQRRTIFWVCPNNFDFPSIERRFQPDMVVADVIDDQRTMTSSPQYKERLHKNYEEILTRSHLVFVNCHSVFESMRGFARNVHILPNAAELLEMEVRHCKKPVELRRIKGPVIGYVGNLDVARLDLDLLMTVATERPDWNLVFIGSMHRGKEIRKLDRFRNVHFLGVRVYDQAIRYIRHFNVAMIPHLDNELTRNMNPLKLYVYFSLHVPVVTTGIANVEDFREFIQVGHTPEEFIERIDSVLDRNPISGNLERIHSLLKRHSWDDRVRRVLALVDSEFTGRTKAASTVAPART